jgi:hypothetical protein
MAASMLAMASMARPSTPPGATFEMTRDQRIEARTLHAIGWKYIDIVKFFQAKQQPLSYRQVNYACNTKATPTKRSGRPTLLTPGQIDQLIEFISQSKEHRRMPFWKVAIEIGFGVGEHTIRRTLARAGYTRHIALRKPPISETNRKLRLAFAHEHLSWTDEQWDAILWSDETWVTPGRHRPTYVTRNKWEELDPTCILDNPRKKKGWMFWGCFSGKYGKGPGIFWEKDWGWITKESYQQHTIPVVHGWMRLCPGQIFMQDGAPGHAATETLLDLIEREIQKIDWPPFSPDLNPIEKAWNWMKDWINVHYPQEQMSYDELRKVVQEAWDAIPEEWLIFQVRTMHERCEDIIKVNGMHTKW